MKPSNPNTKCGKYSVNYNTDDLIEIYTDKLVLKLAEPPEEIKLPNIVRFPVSSKLKLFVSSICNRFNSP